jgi:hypothetical protein
MAPRKAIGKATAKIGALIDDQLARNNMTEEQAAVARAANKGDIAGAATAAPRATDPIAKYLQSAEISDPETRGFVRNFVSAARQTDDLDGLYEEMRAAIPEGLDVADADTWFDELVDLAREME